MGKTQNHRNSIKQWLAVGGGWVGGWLRLAVGGPWGLSSRAVPKKNSLGFFRIPLSVPVNVSAYVYAGVCVCAHFCAFACGCLSVCVSVSVCLCLCQSTTTAVGTGQPRPPTPSSVPAAGNLPWRSGMSARNHPGIRQWTPLTLGKVPPVDTAQHNTKHQGPPQHRQYSGTHER